MIMHVTKRNKTDTESKQVWTAALKELCMGAAPTIKGEEVMICL